MVRHLQERRRNWLREAEFSNIHDHSAGRRNQMRRDRYGNIFYYMDEDYMPPGMMMERQQNMPSPVLT